MVFSIERCGVYVITAKRFVEFNIENGEIQQIRKFLKKKKGPFRPLQQVYVSVRFI
jgi:hypothetical protein